MKKIALALFILLTISGCGNGTNSSSASQASVQSITIGKMTGDTQASEFSSIITFINTANAPIWQFGFYMPRSFESIVNNNPNLVMQICNQTNHCQALIYQKAPSVTNNDLSAGYTTILAPSAPYPLEANQAYTISLLHNNQWGPGNYSSVMQNFFIIANNQVINITPNSNMYHLLDYNQTTVTAGINSHISTIWANSNKQVPVVSLVPTPESYITNGSSYSINSGIIIHNRMATNNTIANYISSDLLTDLNITSSVDNNVSTSGIILNTISDPSVIQNNPEGYQIVINSSAINIYALNNTGAFYALQSLRQLWNQNPIITGAMITDYPRFKYRGVLLDTARHYFSLAEIKTLIDIAATHKLNTLHIHFADDEGFRLAMSTYPTLSSIGDIRAYGQSNIALMFLAGNLDTTNYTNAIYPFVNTLYQGTYSSSDISAMIQYANSQQITIIPEIDLPGHARALIKSLPSDFVDPNDQSVFISVQGYTDDVIPVCTYGTGISVGPQFTTTINQIVQNVAAQFNNQTTLYATANEISVGGDEVAGTAWSNDSSCQGNWVNMSALNKSQYFFQKLASSNSTLKFSGWQQFVQEESVALGPNVVPANQTGHVWVWSTSLPAGISQATNLANNNYPTVLAYADQTYFDIAYTGDINEPGFTWSTSSSDTQAALSSALSSLTTVNNTDTSKKQNIVGLEGALWSENLANYNHMIYMALPKMAGLSEASWSNTNVTTQNNKVDWQSLATRLGCGNTGFLGYLYKLYGVHYRGIPNGINLEVPANTICQ